MKKDNLPILTIILLCLASCNKPYAYYVSEPYVEVNGSVPQTDAAVVREIEGGENYNAYNIIIKDSLAILYTPMNPKGFYSVMNIDNGEDLGTFCPKGRGPDESMNMHVFSETYESDGDIKANVFDNIKERVFEWNITRSLCEGKTVYDTIRPFPWIETVGSPYNCGFRLNDKEYFTCAAAVTFEEIQQVVPPRYTIRSLADNSELRKYRIFTDTLYSFDNTSKWSLFDFFSQEYDIHPDKSKIAMTMAFYPQINILDLNTGKLNAYRLKDVSRPSTSKRIWHYSSVACSEKYIYALYQNKNLFKSDGAQKTNTHLHIFDWNGNMLADQVLNDYL